MEPTFAPYTFAAGLYEADAPATPTISTPNALVVSSEMDEELAYQVTKAIFENVEELRAIHPAANDTTVEFTMAATPVPLHPGALRYFEEIGATIPDRLRE